ncbi:triose-phosphate isomerase [Lachnospiraceae bacterium NSJ-29]|uniref:Triosephosphate isomerase n=2 Tax=Wansuia hejianensis TaxID=2763667 RepID=A0A926EYS9_9FIRM|nr:triose-phosphate isomerase [Wansuia hejianensis]MBC8591446.1 triose-phosphate isomerase [Wansuia hejianensis]
MRKPIIAGNWKMNKTIKEALQLVEEIKSFNLDKKVEAVVCVPFIAIKDVKKSLESTDIKLGAQNMHWEENGAFTGEISPLMLKELGVDYVILGHSERRQYFNETDETVNKKMKSALEHNLKPILCVGETLQEKETGKEKEIVKAQITKAFQGINKEEIKNIVIAYEPIWAIGTGKTASADDANEMIGFIRNAIEEIYGKEAKKSIRIQYGGSVKPDNIAELMSKTEVDGALVGGASLKADDFQRLVNY